MGGGSAPPPPTTTSLGCRVFRGVKFFWGAIVRANKKKKDHQQTTIAILKAGSKPFSRIPQGKKAAALAMACNGISYPITRLQVETCNPDHGRAASSFLQLQSAPPLPRPNAHPLDALLSGRFAPPPPPCVTLRRVAVSSRGPRQSPVLSFACCVGSLRFVDRCRLCSCWCRFRVCGAPSLVYRGKPFL